MEASFIKRPTADFYEKIYAAINDRYTSFEEIDPRLIENKHLVKELIASVIYVIKPKSVLGYACGTAYIEHLLLKECVLRESQLLLSDFALNLFKIFRGYGHQCQFISELEMKNNNYFDFDAIDLVYFVQFFYALNKSELVNFLLQLRKKYKPGCVFITTFHSNIKSVEIKNEMLELFNQVLYISYNALKGNVVRFMGWDRHPSWYLQLLNSLDFIILEQGVLKNQEYFLVFKARENSL